MSLLFNLVLVIYLMAFFNIEISADEENVDKLKVQVYYESKCPDSIRFFRDQLYPSLKDNGRLNFTDLELIPFGKAFSFTDSRTQQLAISCQHGMSECVDNALHACILETTDFFKAFNVIACLMRSYSRELDKCKTIHNLNVDPIDDCVQSRSTAEILQKYEKQTQQIDLSFVPSIALDGIFNEYEQDKLLRQFDRNFCKAYKEKFGKRLENCSRRQRIQSGRAKNNLA